LSERNHRQRQKAPLPLFPYLTPGAKRLIPLFALSSSIAQILCQNGTIGKGKKRLYRCFLI
ncbi:hypothetical protein SLL00_06230, partial [Metabacillus indicus]|uniref:hypothetical protein n=1 Tax=Metabacillus indicus TaxID=246786 RepID=UPI002A0480FD